MGVKSSGPVTPKADQSGIKVKLCNPEWFKKGQQYRVTNPLADLKDYEFSGDDLNFMARALYAEGVGSGACPDNDERRREKLAIIHVCYFRLGRKGYPNNAYVAKSFTDALKAPGQFESVFKANQKLDKSAPEVCETMPEKECSDLCDALTAIRDFLASGPAYKDYPFDKFLAAAGRKGWTKIGGNDFGLFPANKAAMEKLTAP